jgi:signal transduction histidine kinase
MMYNMQHTAAEDARMASQEANSSIGAEAGWIGLLVAGIACGGALAQGLARGWSPAYALGYLALALAFLALSQAYRLPLLRRLLTRQWLFLLIAGLAAFALQVMSGDPYLQPMAFSVPLVYAALAYGLVRTIVVATLYLGLMALGLLIGGPPYAIAVLLPTIGYGTMIVALLAFMQLIIRQAAAREYADGLARDLARQRDELARLVAENQRLHEEARRSATLAERNRLARELHDTIAQGLTAVTMQLDAAQRSFERDPARSKARLARAYTLTRDTLADVRASVWTLADPLVDGASLPESIAELVESFAARTEIAARYEHRGPPPELGHAAATQILRIVQEALHNVEKHAEAAAVSVSSELSETGLRLHIRDDGRGFDALAPTPGPQSGFGLYSLHERARLAGGSLDIASAPGQGTVVALSLPADAAPLEAQAHAQGSLSAVKE